LYSSVTAIEDQHFEEHWGVRLPAHVQRRGAKVVKAASPAGPVPSPCNWPEIFSWTAATGSFRRKMQEILLALQIERRYTKPQIFTMYANQVYLAHWQLWFCRGIAILFCKPGLRI